MNPNMIFEDFDRKYQHSFVQIAFKNEKPALFQLRRIVRDGSKFPKLELQSNLKGTILLNYNTNAKIIFKIPQTGYIQLDKTVAYYTRRPERQWKRGINVNNTSILHPLVHYNHLETPTIPFNFNTVNAIFETKYSTLKDALNKINKEKYNGVALSRNIAIVNRPKKDYCIIFYRFLPVGTVNKITGEIVSENFLKEILNETN